MIFFILRVTPNGRKRKQGVISPDCCGSFDSNMRVQDGIRADDDRAINDAIGPYGDCWVNFG